MSTKLIFQARTELYFQTQKIQYLRKRLTNNPSDEDLVYFLACINRAMEIERTLTNLLRAENEQKRGTTSLNS